MRLRATSGRCRGKKYEGTIIAGEGGKARLVIAGIILLPADCSTHGFVAEQYTAAEIGALNGSGYKIRRASRRRRDQEG
jgi:hypothetical protein